MIRPVKILVTAALFAGGCLLAQPARAQLYIGRAVPHRGSVEVSGGVNWTMGFDLGTSTAELTRNPGTGPGPFDLFTAATRVGSIAGVQGRVGVYLSRSVLVEGGVQYSRPVFSSELANDAEQASDTVATETLARYVFDGSLLYHFGAKSGGNVVPFVAAGGGYIRELHDGYGVVETGNEIHAAAGIKYWFTSGRQRFGLRADAGIISRSGGVDFDAALHALPTDSTGIEAGRRTLSTASVGFSYLF